METNRECEECEKRELRISQLENLIKSMAKSADRLFAGFQEAQKLIPVNANDDKLPTKTAKTAE